MSEGLWKISITTFWTFEFICFTVALLVGFTSPNLFQGLKHSNGLACSHSQYLASCGEAFYCGWVVFLAFVCRMPNPEEELLNPDQYALLNLKLINIDSVYYGLDKAPEHGASNLWLEDVSFSFPTLSLDHLGGSNENVFTWLECAVDVSWCGVCTLKVKTDIGQRFFLNEMPVCHHFSKKAFFDEMEWENVIHARPCGVTDSKQFPFSSGWVQNPGASNKEKIAFLSYYLSDHGGGRDGNNRSLYCNWLFG